MMIGIKKKKATLSSKKEHGFSQPHGCLQPQGLKGTWIMMLIKWRIGQWQCRWWRWRPSQPLFLHLGQWGEQQGLLPPQLQPQYQPPWGLDLDLDLDLDRPQSLLSKISQPSKLSHLEAWKMETAPKNGSSALLKTLLVKIWKTRSPWILVQEKNILNLQIFLTLPKKN